MQPREFDLKVSSNLKGKKEGHPVFILTCKQHASHYTHTKYVIVLSFSLGTSCFMLKGSLLMCIVSLPVFDPSCISLILVFASVFLVFVY